MGSILKAKTKYLTVNGQGQEQDEALKTLRAFNNQAQGQQHLLDNGHV